MHRAVVLSLLAVTLLGCRKQVAVSEPAVEGEAAEVEAEASRCTVLGEPFVLGEKGAGEEGELALPFAAEVGEAAAHDDGFAVGARFRRGKETRLGVVTMRADGKGARLVDLGEARGDLGPPRVAARGSHLLAAIVEPSLGGRSIRLLKIDGEQARFGATLHEKRDESLALEIAANEARGLVAWDEEGASGGSILVSSFDPQTASSASPPRAVSSPETDAESPKLAPRPGGFVLAYIARHGADPQPTEDRFEAEVVGFRQIELLFLDAKGSPQGRARAVTPREGHVAAFDMAVLPDGGVAFVFRDDDGPSGSSGGRVMRALVHPSSIEEPVVLAAEDIGGGVPSLDGRWLTISDAADTTRLARLAEDFTLDGPLRADAAIGNGEVLAARDDVLFVAQPRGKAVRLSAMRCGGK